MSEGDTVLNAFIGAVVSIVLAFLPFATVLGGGVAGYLQVGHGDVREGARVGAFSGGIAFVPVLLILFGLAAFVPFLPLELGALSLVTLFVITIVAGVYFVGAGALGGAVGAYLKDEL